MSVQRGAMQPAVSADRRIFEAWKERHAARLASMDKWVLAAILVERFVTRLFSDKLELLPGWVNFFDIPMMGLLAVYVLVTAGRRPAPKKGTGFGLLVLAFVLDIVISGLLNFNRLHLGAFTLFLVGFLEPMIYMGLTYMMLPREEVARFLIKTIFVVGFMQIFVVLVFDLPRFIETGNPDLISGTFGFNAYQLVFFLMTWNVLILSYRPSPRYRLLVGAGSILLNLLILLIILLAQFRAIIPFALITWMFTFWIVNPRPSKGLIAAGTGAVVFILFIVYLNAILPNLKYNDIFEMFTTRREETLESGKVQAFRNLGEMFVEKPLVLITGTGPGTYASRAFRTFSVAGKQDLANQLYRAAFQVEYYDTEVAKKYVFSILTGFFAFGAATSTNPWFSAVSVPAELGIPGLLVILAIYLKAAFYCWQNIRKDSTHGHLSRYVLVGILLLLQMGFLENWLEVSRVTVPIWVIFGTLIVGNKQ